MTQFDPKQFLDMQTEQVQVKRPPLPVGDYRAMIGEVTSEGWAKDDKSGVRFVVPLKLEIPPQLATDLNLGDNASITLSDSIFPDLTPSGLIDYSVGRSSKLRRYREALDMNRPGYVFSPRKMVGQPILVKVTHETYEGEIVDRVGGVAKIA